LSRHAPLNSHNTSVQHPLTVFVQSPSIQPGQTQHWQWQQSSSGTRNVSSC
jgi:hypothetical protein